MQGGQMPYLDEKVAQVTKYLVSLQMKIKKYEPIEDSNGVQVGQLLHWEVKKNPIGPPGRKCDSYLRYG
ncbi:hypothetical protein ABK046_51245, partial [Streptomyces caeruleatus]